MPELNALVGNYDSLPLWFYLLLNNHDFSHGEFSRAPFAPNLKPAHIAKPEVDGFLGAQMSS